MFARREARRGQVLAVHTGRVSEGVSNTWRLIPDQGEERRRLAEQIGFVIMAAVRVDSTMAVCTAAAGNTKASYLSGTRLSTVFAQIKCEDPLAQAQIAPLAARYDKLYDWRNQVVHGHHDKTAIVRVKPTGEVDVRESDWQVLVRLWYDLDDLARDLLDVAVRLLGGEVVRVPEAP